MSAPRHAADTALLSRLPSESAVVALTASEPSGDALLLDALRRPIDWERLLGLAGRERAIVPLRDRLLPLRGDLATEEFRARLQRLALVAEFQMGALHDRLGRMLALFAAHGIDVLLLKGAGLAYSAYGKPTDRPMGDVDLLVKPEAAGRAWDLVLANGWRRRADVAEQRSYEEHQHLPPLEDADGLQIGLELHTALFTHQAPFRLPASLLWQGARTMAVAGSQALVARPEDQLLHASLHFAWSHEMTFGTWRTLRDVVRVVASVPVDWAMLVRNARAARGASCCYWTLRLARDLAGADVPPEALRELAPALPDAARSRLVVHFAGNALPPPGTKPGSVSLSRALWTLGIRPRTQGHGASRPWLDTEEWVRGPDGMRAARTSAARRLLRQGFGLLRSVSSMVGP
jgi:hypothetical protein